MIKLKQSSQFKQVTVSYYYMLTLLIFHLLLQSKHLVLSASLLIFNSIIFVTF